MTSKFDDPEYEAALILRDHLQRQLVVIPAEGLGEQRAFLKRAIRFIIEFLRVNVRVLGGLSVAHLAALAICAIGIGLLLSKRVSLPAARS